MDSKDKFNAEKWDSIDDTASAGSIKYEFEDTEDGFDAKTETNIQSDDVQDNLAVMQEKTSNNELISKTIKKWLKKIAYIALCVGLLTFLGILSINRINSTCNTPGSSYYEYSSTSFQFGESTFEIEKNATLEELNLSAFSDVKYLCDRIDSDISSSEIELPAEYKLTLDDYNKALNWESGGIYSIRCIINENDTEVCIGLSFDEVPADDFPVSITKGRITSFDLNLWRDGDYNNGYNANGITLQSKAKDVLAMLGEPQKRSGNVFNQMFTYKNASGQIIHVNFDYLGKVTTIWTEL